MNGQMVNQRTGHGRHNPTAIAAATTAFMRR